MWNRSLPTGQMFLVWWNPGGISFQEIMDQINNHSHSLLFLSPHKLKSGGMSKVTAIMYGLFLKGDEDILKLW